MPRFRWTVRRLMVVVAIVAIPLGVLGERRWCLGRKAERYRLEYVRLGDRRYTSGFKDSTEYLLNEWVRGGYLEAWRKYRYAAHHPWLSIPLHPPDPPEPK